MKNKINIKISLEDAIRRYNILYSDDKDEKIEELLKRNEEMILKFLDNLSFAFNVPQDVYLVPDKIQMVIKKRNSRKLNVSLYFDFYKALNTVYIGYSENNKLFVTECPLEKVEKEVKSKLRLK